MQAAKTMSGVEVSAWGAVQNWRTWYLAVINLCDSTVKYAIIYWCPLIIYHMVGENMPQAAGEAVVPHDAVVALLTALPFGFAAVFMLVNARHSAATGQLHFCIYMALCATCAQATTQMRCIDCSDGGQACNAASAAHIRFTMSLSNYSVLSDCLHHIACSFTVCIDQPEVVCIG